MTVTHFSIFGHSMGGIVARFAIGILDRQGVFTNIQLMNYISVVSPHLSIYIPYQEWYGRAINEIVKIGGCPITDQLSFCDSFREGKPLWEILADPAHEFYIALKKFKHKRNYVNTTGDFSVPYFAAAIDGSDHFDDPLNMNISCHSKYPSVITRFDIKETKECRRVNLFEKLAHVVFIGVRVPLVFMSSRSTSWRRHDQVLSSFQDEKEGYYSIHIDREHKFIFEKHQNMNKEETMTKRLDPSKLFPEVGPSVKSRASYPIHCHSAQRRIIEMLKKIDWEQTLVHINSSKAHTMIIGIEDDVQEGRDVVEHFADTFDY
ncbi:hypothetical protein RMCBS344292_05449 [Rhizopus microsporus]|nr:hypothetical protein RMCBS344292_05449 [Rhizopus microsporus]